MDLLLGLQPCLLEQLLTASTAGNSPQRVVALPACLSAWITGKSVSNSESVSDAGFLGHITAYFRHIYRDAV